MADDSAGCRGLAGTGRARGRGGHGDNIYKEVFRWNPHKPWIGFSPVWSGARF